MAARERDGERTLAFVVLGALGACTTLDLAPRAVPAHVAARTPDDLASPATPDLQLMSARELRRLSGLGRTRAESFAAARFERGLGADPRAYDVVLGIGPATTTSVARDLAHLERRFPRARGATYTSTPDPP